MFSLHLILSSILLVNTYNQDKLNDFETGLKFILTNPQIIENYGLEKISDNCAKTVLFVISDTLTSAFAMNLKNSGQCVLGLENEVIFYEGYDAFFKVENFKEHNNFYSINVQFITPNFQPIGENELYFYLEYRTVNQEIDVVKFEKNIIEYRTKVKRLKKTKIDLSE